MAFQVTALHPIDIAKAFEATYKMVFSLSTPKDEDDPCPAGDFVPLDCKHCGKSVPYGDEQQCDHEGCDVWAHDACLTSCVSHTGDEKYCDLHLTDVAIYDNDQKHYPVCLECVEKGEEA